VGSVLAPGAPRALPRCRGRLLTHCVRREAPARFRRIMREGLVADELQLGAGSSWSSCASRAAWIERADGSGERERGPDAGDRESERRERVSRVVVGKIYRIKSPIPLISRPTPRGGPSALVLGPSLPTAVLQPVPSSYRSTLNEPHRRRRVSHG